MSLCYNLYWVGVCLRTQGSDNVSRITTEYGSFKGLCSSRRWVSCWAEPLTLFEVGIMYDGIVMPLQASLLHWVRHQASPLAWIFNCWLTIGHDKLPLTMILQSYRGGCEGRKLITPTHFLILVPSFQLHPSLGDFTDKPLTGHETRERRGSNRGWNKTRLYNYL